MSGPVIPTATRVDPDHRYDFVQCKYNQSFTVAWRSDGTWVAFGGNFDNRLNLSGAPDNAHVPTEIQTPNGENWQDVAVGRAHMCALASDGALWC